MEFGNKIKIIRLKKDKQNIKLLVIKKNLINLYLNMVYIQFR